MNYEKLDTEELLRLALDATQNNRDADAVVMLKTLLDRDPSNVLGLYLLAAQHAQMGLVDRAEAGFRAVVTSAPEFAVARFQLGQLLLVSGNTAEARNLFVPLVAQSDALGAYARALSAAASEDVATTVRELEAGLAQPQAIPALAMDMQRLLQQLRQQSSNATPTQVPPPAPMFLTGYGRQN